MFEKIKKAVTAFMRKAGAETQLGREFKDIFEVSGIPAFNQFYYFGIFIWKWIYRGFYNAWHLIPAPTIKDPGRKRELFRLNVAKALCSELAGMVWTDGAEITVSQKGYKPEDSEATDPLNDYIQEVLSEAGFQHNIITFVEKAAALGGAALKVWYDERRDSDGNVIPGTGKVKLGYCMADQFVPTAWDNADVTEGVFISRIAKDGWYYTRLEWHKWDGETYVISNELYRAPMKQAVNNESQDILGFRYPLQTIYPFLDDNTPINGLEKSLFSYFRTPTANNLDDNSPLGVSIYANAMDTLRALDICFDSFVREFQLGKKRIIVPAQAIKTVCDPETGEFRRYFDPNDEVYQALSIDDREQLKIQDNSVELRIEEHVGAINAFLNILCLQVGLSAGTFSFDTKSGLKTATEVVSENSKTYKTVKCYQEQIKPAIYRLINNILAVSALYDVEWQGHKISDLIAGGYDVAVYMDDGITQDRQTNINEGMALVNAGLLSKKTFLTEPKYGQGMTEEEAQRELERIAAEKKMNVIDFDNLTLNTAE